MPIYLAFSPEEAQAARATGRPLACLGYQLSPDAPALLAPEPEPDFPCLLVLQDSTSPSYGPNETLAHLVAQYAADCHTGILCDITRPEDAFWQAFLGSLDEACARTNTPLWVPAAYGRAAPRAWVTLSSDTIQLPFAQFLENAAAAWPERCVLELRPLSCRMALPCPAGQEAPMDRAALSQALAREESPDFLSEELLCRYGLTETGGPAALLFDTAETLAKKLEAAEAAGFRAAVGLYQELLPYGLTEPAAAPAAAEGGIPETAG